MKKTIVVSLCLVVLLTGVTLLAVGCGSSSGSSSTSNDAGSTTNLSAVTQSCRANQRAVMSACQVYYVDKETWPRTISQLAPTYLKATSLECPAGGSYSLRITNDQPVVTCPNGHKL